MSTSISSRMLLPARDTQALLVKWIVALLVPLAVFTFVWSGEEIVNNVMLGILSPASTSYTTSALIQAAIFIVVFYATVITLAGYLVAADTGRRGMIELWIDVVIFAVVPLVLVILAGLIIGLALCAVAWAIFFYGRGLVRKARNYTPPRLLENLNVLDAEQRTAVMNRAIAGGFWFGTVFAVVSLIVDLIFFVTGSLPTILLIWVVVRTLLLPVLGYFLGRLGGAIALRRTLAPKGNSSGNDGNRVTNWMNRQRQLETLSTDRVREEA